MSHVRQITATMLYYFKNKHQFHASGDDALCGFRYALPSAASLAGV